jgi:probable rRNA maturation factor
MIAVEVENRSGVPVDEAGAVELADRVIRSEGIEAGELGIAFVAEDEMRSLKRDHLGIDESTDVLSFPLDGLDPVPGGVPRALGDVVLCPQVVGEEWRWPLTHGLLHLLGYEHGPEMEGREDALLLLPDPT